MNKERLTIKHLHWELTQVQERMESIMTALENLQSAIAGLNTTTQSVVTKIAELKNVPNNDAAIQSAADSISAATTALNSAI